MITDALQVTAAGEREIVMTRVFDAPRQLLFDALTKPELLKRWLLGPDGWTLDVCEMDLRVGGAYRFVWRRASSGTEMGMGGVFREIVPPERVAATELYDNPWYAGEALVTQSLVEEGGKTTLTVTLRYESREVRDSVLQTPMKEGVATSYDRLADLLATT